MIPLAGYVASQRCWLRSYAWTARLCAKSSWLSLFHDIGKHKVLDPILSKAGPLTGSEWEEIRRHPEPAYHILREIDFLSDVAEILYAHHERYDGRGYPRGLKGEESPLGARILAVAEAYVAMTSHRPYRATRSHGQAVEELMRNSGTQFDARVVEAFVQANERGLIPELSYHNEDTAKGWEAEGQERRLNAQGDAVVPSTDGLLV